MHDPNNPAEVAAEDFADRVLADLEDRAILEACGRYAAELEIEWADRGPLRRYAESRKKEAAAALALARDLEGRVRRRTLGLLRRAC